MSHQHSPNRIRAENSMMCAMCNHEGFRCTGCLQVRCCSQDCQKSDRPVHKLVCKVFSDYSDVNRPSKDARRVLIFAEDGEVPQFAWVRESPPVKEDEKTTNGEDDNAADKIPPLFLRDHLGNLDNFFSEEGTTKVERVKPVLHRRIGHGIVAMGRHRMDSSKDCAGGHRVNHS
jgi:hypothetical protein